MRQLLNYKELNSRIDDLRRSNALEISFDSVDEKGRLYIPYMMNDTIEDYLVLTGPYVHFDDAGRIDQVEADVCEEYRNCYQYHLIGHFWREGHEDWRRLVNTIGNIYDKHAFIGDSVCNQMEMEILPLMGFAPFRFYSPVDWPLDEMYPDTEAGLETMARLAVEAGDSEFRDMILMYYNHNTPFMMRRLAGELASGRHEGIYRLIERKIYLASTQYEMRNYGLIRNRSISNLRYNVTELMHQRGFEGIYPHFTKGRTEITAYEEHPFTLLEEENFSFGIQLMETTYRRDGITRRIIPVE